jgi:hypothetical protein
MGEYAIFACFFTSQLLCTFFIAKHNKDNNGAFFNSQKSKKAKRTCKIKANDTPITLITTTL